MTAMIAAIFVASLLGSVHCAGMCGPFVAFALGAPDNDPAARRRLHLLYHGGRLVTYAAVGMLFGSLGKLVDHGGATLGFQQIAASIAGVMMVLIGLAMLLRLGGVRLPDWPLHHRLKSALMAAQRRAMKLKPTHRALAIGLLTTLLPCGWLYTFAITAAGTASPIAGGVTMIAFWAGTLPVMVTLGLGVQKLTGVMARRLPWLTAALIVIVGLYTVAGRLRIDTAAWAAARPAVEATAATDGHPAESIINTDPPPCCINHAQ